MKLTKLKKHDRRERSQLNGTEEREAHQPKRNGGENIACRNKSLIRGVSKTLPKQKPLSAPGRAFSGTSLL